MTAERKPSIAEMQRIVRTTCPRCGGESGACSQPRTIEDQVEDDAALRAAAPVLLEIVAAALAFRNRPNQATWPALLTALDKVRA